jgi:hypothetical protein
MSALAVDNFHVRAAVQRGPNQLSESIGDVRTHERYVSFDANHARKGDSVSQYDSAETFGERCANALRRRMRPNTSLSAYELAQSLRLSEATIWNALSGNNKSGPSGRVFHKLVDFFGAQFLNEVFGGPNIYCIDPSDTRKAEAMRRIVELQEELRRMG